MNTTSKVTIEKLQSFAPHTVQHHLIRVDGKPVGLLRKFRATATEQCPWQGFAYQHPWMDPNIPGNLAKLKELPQDRCESFYGKDGKAKALAFVLENHKAL